MKFLLVTWVSTLTPLKFPFLTPGSRLFPIVLFCYSLTGCVDGSDVTQTPMLWKYKGHNATMECSHTKDSTYRQMYWYQQLPGKTMKQIVFTTSFSSHQYEEGFTEDKFPAEKKDAPTGSLTVKELQPEDSGVYFCAVSQHSDAGDLKSCTKTQLLVSQ
uniref:Ig-like domain-containing protein n=1 Tax=Kryptolebias marmoratus TaxID=37003 RepID=A0A3Q3GFD8_KRYMA